MGRDLKLATKRALLLSTVVFIGIGWAAETVCLDDVLTSGGGTPLEDSSLTSSPIDLSSSVSMDEGCFADSVAEEILPTTRPKRVPPAFYLPSPNPDRNEILRLDLSVFNGKEKHRLVDEATNRVMGTVSFSLEGDLVIKSNVPLDLDTSGLRSDAPIRSLHVYSTSLFELSAAVVESLEATSAIRAEAIFVKDAINMACKPFITLQARYLQVGYPDSVRDYALTVNASQLNVKEIHNFGTIVCHEGDSMLTLTAFVNEGAFLVPAPEGVAATTLHILARDSLINKGLIASGSSLILSLHSPQGGLWTNQGVIKAPSICLYQLGKNEGILFAQDKRGQGGDIRIDARADYEALPEESLALEMGGTLIGKTVHIRSDIISRDEEEEERENAAVLVPGCIDTDDLKIEIEGRKNQELVFGSFSIEPTPLREKHERLWNIRHAALNDLWREKEAFQVEGVVHVRGHANIKGDKLKVVSNGRFTVDEKAHVAALNFTNNGYLRLKGDTTIQTPVLANTGYIGQPKEGRLWFDGALYNKGMIHLAGEHLVRAGQHAHLYNFEDANFYIYKLTAPSSPFNKHSMEYRGFNIRKQLGRVHVKYHTSYASDAPHQAILAIDPEGPTVVDYGRLMVGISKPTPEIRHPLQGGHYLELRPLKRASSVHLKAPLISPKGNVIIKAPRALVVVEAAAEKGHPTIYSNKNTIVEADGVVVRPGGKVHVGDSMSIKTHGTQHAFENNGHVVAGNLIEVEGVRTAASKGVLAAPRVKVNGRFVTADHYKTQAVSYDASGEELRIESPLKAMAHLKLRGWIVQQVSDVEAGGDVDVKARARLASHAEMKVRRDLELQAPHTFLGGGSYVAGGGLAVEAKSLRLAKNSMIAGGGWIDIYSDAPVDFDGTTFKTKHLEMHLGSAKSEEPSRFRNVRAQAETAYLRTGRTSTESSRFNISGMFDWEAKDLEAFATAINAGTLVLKTHEEAKLVDFMTNCTEAQFFEFKKAAGERLSLKGGDITFRTAEDLDIHGILSTSKDLLVCSREGTSTMNVQADARNVRILGNNIHAEGHIKALRDALLKGDKRVEASITLEANHFMAESDDQEIRGRIEAAQSDLRARTKQAIHSTVKGGAFRAGSEGEQHTQLQLIDVVDAVLSSGGNMAANIVGDTTKLTLHSGGKVDAQLDVKAGTLQSYAGGDASLRGEAEAESVTFDAGGVLTSTLTIGGGKASLHGDKGLKGDIFVKELQEFAATSGADMQFKAEGQATHVLFSAAKKSTITSFIDKVETFRAHGDVPLTLTMRIDGQAKTTTTKTDVAFDRKLETLEDFLRKAEHIPTAADKDFNWAENSSQHRNLWQHLSSMVKDVKKEYEEERRQLEQVYSRVRNAQKSVRFGFFEWGPTQHKWDIESAKARLREIENEMATLDRMMLEVQQSTTAEEALQKVEAATKHLESSPGKARVLTAYIPKVIKHVKVCCGHHHRYTRYWRSEAVSLTDFCNQQIRTNPEIKSGSARFEDGHSGWFEDYPIYEDYTHKDNAKSCGSSRVEERVARDARTKRHDLQGAHKLATQLRELAQQHIEEVKAHEAHLKRRVSQSVARRQETTRAERGKRQQEMGRQLENMRTRMGEGNTFVGGVGGPGGEAALQASRFTQERATTRQAWAAPVDGRGRLAEMPASSAHVGSVEEGHVEAQASSGVSAATDQFERHVKKAIQESGERMQGWKQAFIRQHHVAISADYERYARERTPQEEAKVEEEDYDEYMSDLHFHYGTQRRR